MVGLVDLVVCGIKGIEQAPFAQLH